MPKSLTGVRRAPVDICPEPGAKEVYEPPRRGWRIPLGQELVKDDGSATILERQQRGPKACIRIRDDGEDQVQDGGIVRAGLDEQRLGVAPDQFDLHSGALHLPARFGEHLRRKVDAGATDAGRQQGQICPGADPHDQHPLAGLQGQALLGAPAARQEKPVDRPIVDRRPQPADKAIPLVRQFHVAPSGDRTLRQARRCWRPSPAAQPALGRP